MCVRVRVKGEDGEIKEIEGVGKGEGRKEGRRRIRERQREEVGEGKRGEEMAVRT